MKKSRSVNTQVRWPFRSLTGPVYAIAVELRYSIHSRFYPKVVQGPDLIKWRLIQTLCADVGKLK